MVPIFSRRRIVQQLGRGLEGGKLVCSIQVMKQFFV